MCYVELCDKVTLKTQCSHSKNNKMQSNYASFLEAFNKKLAKQVTNSSVTDKSDLIMAASNLFGAIKP